MTKIEKLMAELLEETARELLNKVKSGDASPSDIKNIRELLKDSGITSDSGEGNTVLEALSEELPFAAPLKLLPRGAAKC